MYSLVLMMAMSGPAETPGGILFNRGGCSGFLGVRSAVRQIVVHRPAVRALGCGGGFLGLRSFGFLRTRTVTTVRGNAAAIAPPVSSAGSGVLGRARVRVQLRIALMRSGEVSLTTKQREAVKTALRDSDVFDVTVVKVHRDLTRQLAANAEPAFGDGTLLKIILDNLPMIVEAIIKIINALA